MRHAGDLCCHPPVQRLPRLEPIHDALRVKGRATVEVAPQVAEVGRLRRAQLLLGFTELGGRVDARVVQELVGHARVPG